MTAEPCPTCGAPIWPTNGQTGDVHAYHCLACRTTYHRLLGDDVATSTRREVTSPAPSRSTTPHTQEEPTLWDA